MVLVFKIKWRQFLKTKMPTYETSGATFSDLTWDRLKSIYASWILSKFVLVIVHLFSSYNSYRLINWFPLSLWIWIGLYVWNRNHSFP